MRFASEHLFIVQACDILSLVRERKARRILRTVSLGGLDCTSTWWTFAFDVLSELVIEHQILSILWRKPLAKRLLNQFFPDPVRSHA